MNEEEWIEQASDGLTQIENIIESISYFYVNVNVIFASVQYNMQVCYKKTAFRTGSTSQNILYWQRDSRSGK